MILDTSALIAVLYGEPEARDFVERIHPPTFAESVWRTTSGS